MHGVERANRLHREGTTNTCDDGVGDSDEETTTREYAQPPDYPSIATSGRLTKGVE
jgi:hypothetical protein